LFDGSSCALAPEGCAFQPVSFAESVHVVDTQARWDQTPEFIETSMGGTRRALVMGLRDYFHKFGFQRAVIGLSGGIDSSVVVALAAEALRPANVVGLAMPSPYSSAHSRSDARALANNLGVAFHEVPIDAVFASYRKTLAPLFAGRSAGVTEENLQSRIRGALLMAYSNQFGHLVLNTANKSECAVGYTTLYGDTNGGLAVIADLWKHEVYALARTYNETRELIPRSVLEKPPSAELRPDQLDPASLPPYDRLDPLLQGLVEREASAADVATRLGEPLGLVPAIRGKLHKSEYKRYQFPPTLRVSPRAWVGRDYPVMHRFEE
jgi:NAD+ synthase (glutamine-hydrolysing)